MLLSNESERCCLRANPFCQAAAVAAVGLVLDQLLPTSDDRTCRSRRSFGWARSLALRNGSLHRTVRTLGYSSPAYVRVLTQESVQIEDNQNRPLGVETRQSATITNRGMTGIDPTPSL